MMRQVPRALLAAVLLSLAPAAGWAQSADPLGVDPITLPPALDRVLRDYEVAWEAGNGAQLASLFTEDGFALNNGSMPMKGRARIAQMLTQPGGDLQLRAFAYAVDDSVGYIIGGFRYPTSTGPGGKFLLALRKAPDGRWLIAADMDNNAESRRRP
jgi:ketosteroid isomerase-like protein